MINGILGKKIGMTQVFDDKGDVHPVTVLQAGPCVITQIKRNNKEGYEAAQIGLVEFVKGKNVSKAMRGHFGKHDLPPVKFMREVAMLDGTEAATARVLRSPQDGAVPLSKGGLPFRPDPSDEASSVKKGCSGERLYSASLRRSMNARSALGISTLGS